MAGTNGSTWQNALTYSNPYTAAIGAAVDVVKNDPGNSLTPSLFTPINTGGFTLNVGSGKATTQTEQGASNGATLAKAMQNPLVIGAVVIIAALFFMRRK